MAYIRLKMGVIKENCSCFATDGAATQFTSRYLVLFQEQIVLMKSRIIKTKTKQKRKKKNSGIMNNRKTFSLYG